ncbi:MAG: hypothetical protein QM731_23475 [Chitinophagaceae bacterium]
MTTARRYSCMLKSLRLVILLLLAANVASSQLTYQTLYVDYDSAKTYKNLTIIPIRPRANGFGGQAKMLYSYPDVISLSQALKQGLVTISERGTASTENVHWLRINNKSNKSIYIASGEMIMGGRQDRMVTRDTVLAPSDHDEYIPVMCVEEGRWSDKEKKFAYYNYANPRLRKVLDQSKNQLLIWKEILGQLDYSKVNSTSLAYTARRQDKKFSLVQEDYYHYFLNQFRNVDSILAGFVCISGDKIIGCDIFAGINLFHGQLEPLLQGYIEEAIVYGYTGPYPKEKVQEYLDKILTSETQQQQYLEKNGKIYRYKNRIFHITGYAP